MFCFRELRDASAFGGAVGVDEPDVSGGVDRDARRVAQFAFVGPGARTAKTPQVCAVRFELLYAGVSWVGGIDVARFVGGDAADAFEGRRAATFFAELPDVFAF